VGAALAMPGGGAFCSAGGSTSSGALLTATAPRKPNIDTSRNGAARLKLSRARRHSRRVRAGCGRSHASASTGPRISAPYTTYSACSCASTSATAPMASGARRALSGASVTQLKPSASSTGKR